MYNANYNLISENRGRHRALRFFVAFLLFKIAWGDAAGVWEKTKGRKACRKKGKHPKQQSDTLFPADIPNKTKNYI